MNGNYKNTKKKRSIKWKPSCFKNENHNIPLEKIRVKIQIKINIKNKYFN